MIVMLQDINKHLSLIEDAIAWAKKFDKASFPYELFKEYRRKLRRIGAALEENCSIAAYGESQVGKSYLMSSLLSSPNSPFMITNAGKSYSFIDELNPSGGNNAKTESTGVITRFTIKKGDSKMENFVRVHNLSVVDIILLLTDSYYNDIKINQDNIYRYDCINKALEEKSNLWKTSNVVQNEIGEDDIKDITDYIHDTIGSNASNVNQSDFRKIIAPVIQYVSYDKWGDIFCLLWNNNKEFSYLFKILIDEYKKLNFQTDIYVPFDAVLREKGTILKIDWLDTVCGKTSNELGEIYTDVYDANGNILSQNFHKGYLSALIAELTFELPASIADDRKFLHKLDLMDFPGTRSRERLKEDDIHTELPRILRRGKVAYLFNKYSNSLRISSLLFCHHNDQKTEPTIGDTINNWIENNIGASQEERANMLVNTNGIAPLFLVATKFNLDLARTKTDTPSNVDKLDEHWKRFNTVFPEIINPNKWLNDWVKPGGIFHTSAFQNIYPLRDFYWSGKNQVFDGYSDGQIKSEEKSVHVYDDYPDYFANLRKSFLNNEFVKQHFVNPEQTWDDVATVNNDGSKAIIHNLDAIAGVLEEARKKKYLAQLVNIQNEMYRTLSVYFEPEDINARNQKVKQIASDIKMSLMLSVGEKPEIFGRIIDNLMIPVGDLRTIAYDIIICHTDTPKDFSIVNFIRKQAEIDPKDNYEENIRKLCQIFGCDTGRLENALQERGSSISEIVSGETETLTTVAGVVTKHIVDYWVNYINNKAKVLEPMLPHSEEVVFMLVSLAKKMGVKKVLSNRIDNYCKVFDLNEQPNVIADYASLILNNFVSSIGRNYLKNEEVENIRKKADSCGIKVDLSPSAWNVVRKSQPLEQTLDAFDAASDIATIDKTSLMKLPLWDNFQRWENLVIIGLLYASDISSTDPVANAKIKELIDGCSALYKS